MTWRSAKGKISEPHSVIWVDLPTRQHNQELVVLKDVNLENLSETQNLDRITVPFSEVREVYTIIGAIYNFPSPVLNGPRTSVNDMLLLDRDRYSQNGAAQFTLFAPMKKPSEMLTVSNTVLLCFIISCCFVIASTHFRWLT